ncbi:hypothetical protein [Piscirickettsia salmonis]
MTEGELINWRKPEGVRKNMRCGVSLLCCKNRATYCYKKRKWLYAAL